MAVFDTPITTDDTNLDKVLKQNIPVVLYLYDKPNKTLDDKLSSAARENVGELLFVRVDVNANPRTHAQFKQPKLPALFTIDEGEIESRAQAVRPADIDAHVDFLLGEGPMPTTTAEEDEIMAASGAAPLHVNQATFSREVLNSDVPVLVDFWAAWCGPCHQVAPALEELAQQYAGRVKVAKVNVDENPQLARDYQARSIPLLVMFKGGKPVNKLVGAYPKPNIQQMIESTLR